MQFNLLLYLLYPENILLNLYHYLNTFVNICNKKAFPFSFVRTTLIFGVYSYFNTIAHYTIKLINSVGKYDIFTEERHGLKYILSTILQTKY